jgi:hypothetical protein
MLCARCRDPIGYNRKTGHINVHGRFYVGNLLGNTIVGILAGLCAVHGLCAVPPIL